MSFMENRKKLQVTWFTAFMVLLGGLNKKGMTGLKATILMFALTWPFIFFLKNSERSNKLSGDIPPNVSFIHASGTFVRKMGKQGVREVSYVDFVTDNKIYPVQQETYFLEIGELARSNFKEKVYAEGFLIKNKSLLGGESFWFTTVRLSNGDFLVKPENSLNTLKKMRAGRGVISWYLGILSFLWLTSLFNIYNIKQKLSMKV